MNQIKESIYLPCEYVREMNMDSYFLCVIPFIIKIVLSYDASVIPHYKYCKNARSCMATNYSTNVINDNIADP